MIGHGQYGGDHYAATQAFTGSVQTNNAQWYGDGAISMREPVELRRQQILSVVQSRGAVKVSVLAAELDVSVVTIRRDVEELARIGRLRRGHGVARPVVDAAEPVPVPPARTAEPAGDGRAVAIVVPEQHSYLYETLHGDVDALMLVQRMAECGVQVPRDCSVVAYDDVVAALGSTPLTAVAPPKAEIGRVAAELLLHRLTGPAGTTGPVRRTELLPSLKVRGSAQEVIPRQELSV